MLDLWPAGAVPHRLWIGSAVAVGLIVGSFANVCIHRLPRGHSVVRPPSRCPSCGALVRPWDNVPIVSYLALLGRCRDCRGRIPLRYPAVEAGNALLYLGLALLMGPSWRTALTMAFLTAMLVLSLIDLEHHLLPDAITLPGIAAGLAASLLPDSPLTPLASAGAAAGGYLALAVVAEAYRRTRGMEGLGQGDWKMVAMLGAFLGWERMLLAVFLATLAGTVVGLALIGWRGRTLRHALPLGSFLGAAGIVTVFAGQPLLDWYGGFFSG